MVNSDRCHDGDLRVDDVGGVPGATHAHLDNGHVDGGVGERGIRDGDQDLEVGHLRAASAADLASTISMKGITSS